MNRGIFGGDSPDDLRRQLPPDQMAQQQAAQNLFEGMGGWSREAAALRSVQQARLAQGFGDNAVVASFPMQFNQPYAQWNVPQVAQQPYVQWNNVPYQQWNQPHVNMPYGQWNVPYQQWNQPQIPQLAYNQQAFQPGYQYNQFMQPGYHGGGLFGLLQRFGMGGCGNPMMGMGGYGPMGMGGMRLPFIGNMFGGNMFGGGYGGNGFRMPFGGRGGIGGLLRRIF